MTSPGWWCLGGVVSAELDAHLRLHGAVVFPSVGPEVPVRPYRGTLYTPGELYEGLAAGYDATPDARAYAWFIDATLRHDVLVTLLRAVHDDAMVDATTSLFGARSVVGVMGGHAVARDDPAYLDAALLGLALAERGQLVLTGGGPGAMEAANLGAVCAAPDQVHRAVARLSAVPSFAPSVGGWAALAWEVKAELGVSDLPVGTGPQEAGVGLRSCGIPTWFYGHEPPNVFAQQIAKLFSNAIREDLLLASSTGGLVVLPGVAGTVQEIFQMSTRLFYEVDDRVPPLVLVGREHWTSRLPVWPLLQTLGRGREMGAAIHLVDSLDEALDLLPH